jgi:hypothetical protein
MTVTTMSESRRVSAHAPARKCAPMHALLRMAHPVHVMAVAMLSLAGCSGCVVPPPLSVAADAGPDSPPVITDLRDSSLNSHRPPDTLTVNLATAGQTSFDLTLYDTDLADDLTVQMFVDYDAANPLDARSNCNGTTVPDSPTNRTASCPTTTLCKTDDVGSTHRLEVEVYDRTPDPNAPFRDDPPGMFSTWTFDLACINQP